MLAFRSNASGTETRVAAGKQTTGDFVWGTWGDSLYRYVRNSMPSDEAYSIRGRVLTISGNLYWHEGDGWIAVPEASKAICRRS